MGNEGSGSMGGVDGWMNGVMGKLRKQRASEKRLDQISPDLLLLYFPYRIMYCVIYLNPEYMILRNTVQTKVSILQTNIFIFNPHGIDSKISKMEICSVSLELQYGQA